MRGLAAAFIAQTGVNSYNEDVAVMDLIAAHQDDVLGSLAIPLPTFLAAYKAANNLLGGIPSPTVNHNLDEEISHVNGTPRLESAASETAENAIAVGNAEGNDNGEEDNTDDDDAMINAANAVKAAAIGGRIHIGRLILDALKKGTIEPIRKFHLQRKENEETKRIKAAFTLPRLNEAAQRVATVIAKEPPAQMPVLRGLVNETANKATSAMERRIQSLEDQLKAATEKSTSKAKKSKGDGKKSPQGILKNKGTPAAPKKTTAPRVPRAAQDENNKGSARAKGKKKPKGRKVSFDGKKAATRTNSRK